MGHGDGYGDRRIGNMGGGAGDRERDRGMGQRDGNRDSGSEMDRWGQEGLGAVEDCEKRMGQKGDGETGRTWNGGMVGTGTEMEIQGGWRGWRRRGTGNKGRMERTGQEQDGAGAAEQWRGRGLAGSWPFRGVHGEVPSMPLAWHRRLGTQRSCMCSTVQPEQALPIARVTVAEILGWKCMARPCPLPAPPACPTAAQARV